MLAGTMDVTRSTIYTNGAISIDIDGLGTHVDFFTEIDAFSMSIEDFDAMIDRYLEVKMANVK